MYKPKFNSVLVEIDDTESEWGTAGDAESLSGRLGKSYSKGKVVNLDSELLSTDKYPLLNDNTLQAVAHAITELQGKDIIWNEGAEAGTTFEEDGKLYGFIYWWDIRGVKE